MTKTWAVVTAIVAVAGLASPPSSSIAAALAAEPFLYQIHNVDPIAIAQSGYKIIVLDPSRDGTPAGAWTPLEIADLKASGKIVLAALHIAEAESSRAYWDPAWIAAETPESYAPAWLGDEDDQRPGIYRVRYWDPDWQQLIYGGPASYLTQVIAQGFDGVVLDSVDAYLYWGPDGHLPSAQRRQTANEDMIALVEAIAADARALSANPEYLVVPQNGVDLLADDGYLATLSGLLAESIWFDGDHRQKSRYQRIAVPRLDRVLASNRPVFLVEYPTLDKNIDTFYDRAESKGYVPLATTRELDWLAMQPRHPPGTVAPFVPQNPLPNADAFPDAILDFTWTSSSQDATIYRIRFSGSDARQQVFTFPKSGILQTTSYTPTVWEWRSILRQARANTAGRIYWWITTQDENHVMRSSPARVLYRMHPDVPTTIFWVGAQPGQAGPDERNTSAWDADWLNHFGGVDDPFVRSQDPLHPYWPPFTPLENPFYVSLPYNDFTDSGVRRPNFASIVPWATFAHYGPLESAVKNRWVKITFGATTCYAQWEDAGPWQTYDFRYVFGSSRPRNKENLGAGMEVSPAVRDCLGLDSISATDWRFLFDDEMLPDGPWNEVVTASQITPPPPPP